MRGLGPPHLIMDGRKLDVRPGPSSFNHGWQPRKLDERPGPSSFNHGWQEAGCEAWALLI